MGSDITGKTGKNHFPVGVKWYRRLKERGFFRYIGRNVLLIILVYIAIVLLVFLIGKYLINFQRLFQDVIGNLSDRFVFLLFFASESFLGLVPVDLFVIWTQKFPSPILILGLLGVLSYIGGIISYGIGLWISRLPKVKVYSEKRLRRYIEFVRTWGGAFIIISALFPFSPFSMVAIAITLFKYPFRLFLLYALFRLVRFILQGIIFFDILNMDLWVI
ncbi:MAG: hypothetical protein JXA39_06375 [Bacteroidales bacterium]|nr:hypothetical protein [Bacteroidales bacterium]